MGLGCYSYRSYEALSLIELIFWIRFFICLSDNILFIEYETSNTLQNCALVIFVEDSNYSFQVDFKYLQ
jgi:hypothetical protein